jgi:hypothetical protein
MLIRGSGVQQNEGMIHIRQSDGKEGREGQLGAGAGEGRQGKTWRVVERRARLTCLWVWYKAGGRRSHAGALLAG